MHFFDCLLWCFAGGGVPRLTRRDDSEVCVVICSQRQGQVYLCDTANLGSSARSGHPVSEGCSGNFQAKLEDQAGSCPFCQQNCTNA